MKKQGFTLIELMVVIVIMGILAAVAVPKLFGMIAKAKVAEIPPAAMTYIKLQDVYAHEHHAVGGWTTIGYFGPGTEIKGFSDAQVATSTAHFTYWSVIDPNGKCDNVGRSETRAWVATSKTALNDCPSEHQWGVQAWIDRKDNRLGIETWLDDEEHCLPLAATFLYLGNGKIFIPGGPS